MRAFLVELACAAVVLIGGSDCSVDEHPLSYGTAGGAGERQDATGGSGSMEGGEPNTGGSSGTSGGSNTGGSGHGGGGNAGGSRLDAGTGSIEGGEDSGPAGEVGNVAAGVRWVGRYDVSQDPMHPKFGDDGAGFVARISVPGTSIAVLMNDDKATIFQPLVDGTLGTRIQAAAGMATLLIPTTPGTHKVELYREEGTDYGNISQFIGFVGGTLLTPPTFSGRLIETVSDQSLSGYGDLGTETYPNGCNMLPTKSCNYTMLDMGSSYQSVTPTIARALDADWSIFARTNCGYLPRGFQGADTACVVAQIYDQAYPAYPSGPKWITNITASVVIVDLGLNDYQWANFGPVGPTFKDGFKKLMNIIRAKNGNAWIFVVTGPILPSDATTDLAGYFQAGITELADPKMEYLDFGHLDCMKTGCGQRAGSDEIQKIANIMVPLIKQKLGW